MEKCITKAGSEKVISFAEKKSQAEESKWETIGGVRIRRPNTELQKPHVVQGDNSSIYAGETTFSDAGHNATVVEKVIRFLWMAIPFFTSGRMMQTAVKSHIRR